MFGFVLSSRTYPGGKVAVRVNVHHSSELAAVSFGFKQEGTDNHRASDVFLRLKRDFRMVDGALKDPVFAVFLKSVHEVDHSPETKVSHSEDNEA